MSKYGWYRKSDSGCGWLIAGVLFVIALIFVGPMVMMWLWNWLAVDLFSLPVIGYWEAFGLEWLCQILFGRVVTVRSN
jgi:hypothetical protein